MGNPLETSAKFVNVKCPKCNGPAKRETDTMDTFVDSSWYFHKFASRDDGDAPFKKEELDYWCPVDTYIGGIEHAILHLLYARFYTKSTRDLGLHNINEPFSTLITQGMINKAHPFCEKCNKFLPAAYDNANKWIGEYDPEAGTCKICGSKYILQSAKMSKSLGNTVSPSEITEKYGADTARLFILHTANPEKEMEWTDMGVDAEYKFIKRIWTVLTQEDVKYRTTKHVIDDFINFKIHSTIESVTQSMDILNFRDAVTRMAGLIDTLKMYTEEPVDKKIYEFGINSLIKMLYPFIPHMMEEIWAIKGNKKSLTFDKWPKFNEKMVDVSVKDQWDAFDNIIEDIKNITKLLADQQFKEVIFIVADEWRNKMVSKTFELLKAGTDRGAIMKEIMKNAEFKAYGKDINKLLPKIMDNLGKYGVPFKDQQLELEFWKQNMVLIEKRVNLKITIEAEATSKDQKKSQALPGKPALVIK